jgi:hypothetical protein
MSVSRASNVASSTLIVPAYAMCPDGVGSMLPSGTNLTMGAMRAGAMARAMSGRTVRKTKLCLPTTYGPFCSTPPVATMTVVVPLRMASRTSKKMLDIVIVSK